ncbi:hypothetical protein DRN87_06205, partial [Candidatus Geothermarchaeota archaeon]
MSISRKLTYSSLLLTLLILLHIHSLAVAYVDTIIPSIGYQAKDEWWTGTTAIKLDGSIDPPDAPIIREGNTYKLTKNIKSLGDGIIVQEDDITGNLDGGREFLRQLTGDELATRALGIAEEAARYVISSAEPVDGGYRWVSHHARLDHYNPIFQDGAAGVGYFLLKLYKLTGRQEYLDYAVGAAQWVISEARFMDGGVTWPHYDDEKPEPGGWYLTPGKSVAGVAEFLLELYKVTGDSIYLEYAEGAAQWIINTAFVQSGPGSYVEYNPYHQAAFGIYSSVQRDVGVLMLHLYNETGDTVYLEKAKEIADWIVYTAECSGDVCKWYDDRGYKNLYTVSGTAVLADFLYDMYYTTGVDSYGDVANGMLNWIESVGVSVDGAIKFRDSRGKFRTIIEGDWSRLWLMTPADVFIKASKITGSHGWLTVAEAYAEWLISISEPEMGGFKVPLIEDEDFYHAWINAKIFNFAVKLYLATGRQKYLDYASSLLTWIETTATKQNGYSWPLPSGIVQSIFYRGSSGIGYYLAEAAEYLRKTGGSETETPQVHIFLQGIDEEYIDSAPLDRPFKVLVDIYNPSSTDKIYKVALRERTGFVAGPRYGDGDEEIEVRIPAQGRSLVSFDAKIYGIPREGELVDIVIMDPTGNIITEVKEPIKVSIEASGLLAVLAPSWVKTGYSPTITVLVNHTFTYETKIMVEAYNSEGTLIASSEKMVDGSGVDTLTLHIPREYTRNKSILEVQLVLRAFFPELGYR